jgi:hypothetical protein
MDLTESFLSNGNDVADLIRRHLDAPTAGNKELPVGATEILRFRDIGCQAAECLGRLDQLAIMNWIYVGAHDAVAPCAGERRLRDAFAAKRIAFDSQHPQAPSMTI